MEHKSQPLAPTGTFLRRLLSQSVYAFIILTCTLTIGMLGYHYLGRLSWIDSVYNASMIISGMGPANELPTVAAKLFASCYAILSGVLFIGVIGIILTPVFHRIMHKLHLEN